jgi:hypothetical protein
MGTSVSPCLMPPAPLGDVEPHALQKVGDAGGARVRLGQPRDLRRQEMLLLPGAYIRSRSSST